MFQFANISLRDSGFFGKFLLRHSGTDPCINHGLNDGMFGLKSLIFLSHFRIPKLFFQKIVKPCAFHCLLISFLLR